jgi:hypothetical protein
MFHGFKAKIIQLVFAASLAFPVAGVNMLEAHAACYYQGYTDTLYGSFGNPPTTFTTTAWYTIGYSCSGVPQEINLTHFQDTVTFGRCTNYCNDPTRTTTEGDWCNGYQNYYCNIVWYHVYSKSCNSQYGSCTITRDEYPNQWKTYTWYSASQTFWVNFNTGGGDYKCRIIHSFVRHIWELPCII